jgi:glycosyltransferase involved in cell wall biosynthesis
MEFMELITISLPVYNVEKYVEKSLLSAFNQTYDNIEYLIVDDKGTDNSMQIVRKVVDDSFGGLRNINGGVIIVEHPFNLGLGAARNTAIDCANGKYLFFMDSDDIIPPDCIQKLYEEMMRTNVDVVCGTRQRFGYPATPRKKGFVERNKEQIILGYFDGRFPVMSWNKLYDLDFLRRNGIKCIPHQTIEDNYFSFMVALNMHAYSLIPDITYVHCGRTDSVVGGGWSESVAKQWTQIIADLFEALRASSLPPDLKLTVKKKLFKKNWGCAKVALMSPHHVQHYVDEYLNPAILRDKDLFRSVFLLFAYLVSALPSSFKKTILFLHAKSENFSLGLRNKK